MFIPDWASVLNQHFCLWVKKPNSKCCNEKRDGLAHTGENSSSVHIGTPCSTSDYESVSLPIWSAFNLDGFFPPADSPWRWKMAILHFRFMFYQPHKPAEREPQHPSDFLQNIKIMLHYILLAWLESHAPLWNSHYGQGIGPACRTGGGCGVHPVWMAGVQSRKGSLQRKTFRCYF